jgi:hypothetical protein
MLKLKQVYGLPATNVRLVEYVLTEKWIPEVADLAYSPQQAALAAMDEEGLLTVKQVVYASSEGDRYAALYTLWFKGAPVGIFQVAGRGGEDQFKRWITAPAAFVDLCQYVRTKLSNGEDQMDIYDPEHNVYPEEVFSFYGTDFGTALGFPPEPAAKGFIVLFDGARLVPGANPSYALVTATPEHEPMPEYLRQQEYVYQKVAPLSAEELAKNPRIAEVSKEDGHTQIYWYKNVIRPSDQPVLAV